MRIGGVDGVPGLGGVCALRGVRAEVTWTVVRTQRRCSMRLTGATRSGSTSAGLPSGGRRRDARYYAATRLGVRPVVRFPTPPPGVAASYAEACAAAQEVTGKKISLQA